MLRIQEYRLKCGFHSSRGLALSRQADGLVPPLKWKRAGVLPAWPPRGRGAVGGEGVCLARWPSGLHVLDKGPAPGRGRGAPGGRGGGSDPPSEAPSLPPGGSRRTPPDGI